MRFNKPINGIINEIKFVNYLNNKMVGEISPDFYLLLDYLYDELNEDDVIYAYKNPKPQKTDIIIEVNLMIALFV